MKISFLLVNEKYPYQGVVRPFINWAKNLSENGHQILFLSLNCGEKLRECIENIKGIESKNFRHFNEIITYFNETKETKPDIILTYDDLQKLKLLGKLKSLVNIKTGVYVQLLFGVHSIASVFSLKYLPLKDRILFKCAKALPFTLFKTRYTKLLLRHNVIIANSQTTAMLLNILYGIEPDGIVYPPVDTEIFSPKKVEKENQVLLYAGSFTDVQPLFIQQIIMELQKRRIKVLVMGNNDVAQILKNKFEIEIISGISDAELSAIYSRSKLTICPQKWEQFGYVVAESIACGTPSLSFNLMGPKEIVEQTKFGLLSNNEKEFLEHIKNLETRLTRLKLLNMSFEFDVKKSAESLLNVIKNV